MALSTRLTDTGLGVRAELDDHDTQLAQIEDRFAYLMVNDANLPDYNTTTKVFDFKSTVGYNCTLVYGKGGYYNVPASTTVTNGLSGTSSATKLIFNTTTKAFSFILYYTAQAANEVLLAVFRTLAATTTSVTSLFKCTINGEMEPLLLKTLVSKDRVSVMIPLSGKFPNIITTASTFTIYEDTMIVTARKTYRVAADTVIDLTAGGTVATSAKKLYYNTLTSTFFIIGWSTETSTATDILVATIRFITGVYYVSIDCPWTIDGIPSWQRQYIVSGVPLYDYPIMEAVDSNVVSISHRGYGTAPENTLPAYILSKKYGYRNVECDVQFTSDAIPVLCHDATIDRTSDGTGNLVDFTLAQLLTYDFGSWKSATYTGTRIPTFEQFVITCRKLNLRPNIELKSVMDAGQITIIANILRKHHMIDRSSFHSFTIGNLTLMLSEYPAARVGISTTTMTTGDIDGFATALSPTTNNAFVLAQADNLTQVLHDYCIAAGFEVEAWNVATSAMIISMVEMGVKAVFVDTLNVAQALLL